MAIVKQQAEAQASRPQVIQTLDKGLGAQSVDAFELNRNSVLHQEISDIGTNAGALVVNGDGNLRSHAHSATSKLVEKGTPVDLLEKT